MYAIALETSGRIGSVALTRHGKVIDEQTYPHGLQHATAIVPMLEGLCRSHSISPADLQTIFVSIGPGSFTGLRVGVTLAKSLAFATRANIVAVPTARVLIDNLPDDATHGLIVLDAKRGQVFTARYTRTNGQWSCVEDARLDTLTDMLKRSPRPIHLIGEGITYHRQSIPVDPDVVVTDESLWVPRAATVARIGQSMADRGEFIDPYRLTPTYVRLPEAEEKRLIAEGLLSPDGKPLP